jgi:hypothetical protein
VTHKHLRRAMSKGRNTPSPTQAHLPRQ